MLLCDTTLRAYGSSLVFRCCSSSRDGLPVQKRRAGQPMPSPQTQVARPPAAVKQSAVPPSSRVVPPKAPKDAVAARIAVSPDTFTIAWVWNDGVHLLRRASPATVKDPRWWISGKAAVASIAVLDGDLLAVGYTDGVLELCRLETGQVLWRNDVAGTWNIRAVGPFLTALSPASELLVAGTRRAPAVRSWPKPLPPGTLSYAVLPPSRLAAGMRDGFVVLPTVEFLRRLPDLFA